jgi:hypothetical protein
MLKFTCDASDIDIVCTYFIDKLAWAIKGNKVQTLVVDYYDKDICGKLREIVEKTADGFVFDAKDQIGEEPYGFVCDFFEEQLSILEDVKGLFPSVGIDGYVFVNENGVYDCVMRQRVYSTSKMEKVEFIDQLQCISCNEWVDAVDALYLIEDGDIESPMDKNGELLYPSAYSNSGLEAAFCVCSEECKEDIMELAGPEFAEELEKAFDLHMNE